MKFEGSSKTTTFRLANVILFARAILLASVTVLSFGGIIYVFDKYGPGSTVRPDMRFMSELNRTLIYVHIFASAVALMIGPLQFWTKLRLANPKIHRWLGRAYLGGIVLGGSTGLVLALQAKGGLTARLGFACLAVLWLYTGARAYTTIRQHKVQEHRRWMLRNFSLTFGAVILRVMLPTALNNGIPFDVAYPAIAWLAWVPNLVVVEAALWWQSKRSSTPGMSTDA